MTNPSAGFSLAFNKYGTVAGTPFVPTDQRLEGPQGITFRTPALERALDVVGPTGLRLVAASTAGDTDWHAKLSDVAPDGSETLVTEGALRASHRALDHRQSTAVRPYHTHTDPRPIAPGRFYAYDVEIEPTAYRLAKGHRLQLRVTSTDLPTHLPGSFAFDRRRPQDVRLDLNPPATNTVRLVDSFLSLPAAGSDGGGVGLCLARRSPIGPRNIGRIRLGHTRARLLRLPVRPPRRTRRSLRYCVRRSRGRVTAVFSSRARRARAKLVVTTAARARQPARAGGLERGSVPPCVPEPRPGRARDLPRAARQPAPVRGAPGTGAVHRRGQSLGGAQRCADAAAPAHRRTPLRPGFEPANSEKSPAFQPDHLLRCRPSITPKPARARGNQLAERPGANRV